MLKKIIPLLVYSEAEIDELIQQCVSYEASGADELYISCDSKEHSVAEEFLKAVGELVKQVDIPILISCHIERFEDVKKALYTGATAMVVKSSDLGTDYAGNRAAGIDNTGVKALKESAARFGGEKIYLEVKDGEDFGTITAWAKEFKITRFIIDTEKPAVWHEDKPIDSETTILIKSSFPEGITEEVLRGGSAAGIITTYYQNKDLYAAKKILKESGIPVNTYESRISFAKMKKNSDGLLPVVVQDYQTKDVLMVAYMNEEAYNLTVETGRMTYYSRSRSKLWLKGETSGHFQYVKSLTLDCDKDTLLAKVRQVGAACHTGSQSCFFEETVKKPYDDTNPLTVLEEVYQVITDRKAHPKEGSYTNYLFDKGIDKILKKCGEEASEIIIAAKNPDAAELKYEISDFLYHMMVLMAECGLDWKDILKELAHRR